MLQLAARCRAAVPLAASDPIQASEARAPLAESRGVCAALWTRMGFDVNEAVPLTAPSVPAAQAVEARSMCWVARFGSEQPTSALGSRPRPRPPGWAAHTGPTRAHCPPSVAAGRWGLEVRLERRNLACCSGGLPRAAGGLPVQLVLRAAALPGPGRIGGGLCPLGMAPGRRRGGRGRRRCVALPVWAGAYLEARPEWEAREYRLNNRERWS